MHYNSQDYSLKAMTNFLAVFSKVTVVPVHTIKTCREVEVLLYSFYILTTWEFDQFHALATLLPGNNQLEATLVKIFCSDQKPSHDSFDMSTSLLTIFCISLSIK